VRHLPFLLLSLLYGPTWGDECDQLPKPSVSVQLLDEAVTLNTQYGYKELTHLGSALGPRPGKLVMGLTRGNAVVKFSSATPTRTERTGQWECASPQLTLTVGFRPMTVYVGKEFPAGSCAYNEIHQHELRHVKTYQSHLAKIKQDLGDTLNQRFATGGAWRGPLGQTHARLQRELDERWLPYVQRELRRVDADQELIDTPEEYERIANSCNGEIRKRAL
jgi:hypothetical protein